MIVDTLKGKRQCFGLDYFKKVIEPTEQGKNEIVQIGDMANELMKAYAKELSTIIENHKRTKGTYYVYVLHCKDPQFPTAQKWVFCSMRQKDLYKAPMKSSTDMWKIDNQGGEIELMWSIPHNSKIDRVLKSPTDEKTYTWTKEAIAKGTI